MVLFDLAASASLAVSSERRDWLKVNPGAPVTTVAPENRAAFPLAPVVDFKTLDGKAFQLGELRGRVVLLNFWATWCIPCRSEIPELNNMHRDLEARGLSVVGVSTYDGADGVRNFWKDIKQDYQVLLGDQNVESQFAVSALPTTFILDREGRIRGQDNR